VTDLEPSGIPDGHWQADGAAGSASGEPTPGIAAF
jgi:hypothetical protein